MTARVAAGARNAKGAVVAKGVAKGAVVAKAPNAAFAPLSFAKRDEPAVEDRIPLFEIDGTEYTIPAVVPTGDALGHLGMVARYPDEARRGMYLVAQLAGPDALAALIADADMTAADWQRLITILSDHVFGQLEAPGN